MNIPTTSDREITPADARIIEIYETLSWFYQNPWLASQSAFDVIDTKSYLTPRELIQRWIAQVSTQVSQIISASEETRELAIRKQEILSHFYILSVQRFQEQINSLPLHQRIRIQSQSLVDASDPDRERAIASILGISITQLYSLVAWLASESDIYELIKERRFRYIPATKETPYGTYTTLLSQKSYDTYTQSSEKFPVGVSVHWYSLPPQIHMHSGGMAIIEGGSIPKLHIPENIPNRYQISYAPPDRVKIVFQDFVDTYRAGILLKKFSFQMPKFLGDPKSSVLNTLERT